MCPNITRLKYGVGLQSIMLVVPKVSVLFQVQWFLNYLLPSYLHYLEVA